MSRLQDDLDAALEPFPFFLQQQLVFQQHQRRHPSKEVRVEEDGKEITLAENKIK